MKIRMIIPLMILLTVIADAQPSKDCPNAGKNPRMQQQRLQGQPNPDMPGCKAMIPDLTEEQKLKMEDLKIELMKAMKPMKNKLMEKEVQLNALRTEDKPDMNKIFALIDEIGLLKAQMMKEQEKHYQAVRQILNEKQRIHFDMNPGRGHDMGHGPHGDGM